MTPGSFFSKWVETVKFQNLTLRENYQHLHIRVEQIVEGSSVLLGKCKASLSLMRRMKEGEDLLDLYLEGKMIGSLRLNWEIEEIGMIQFNSEKRIFRNIVTEDKNQNLKGILKNQNYKGNLRNVNSGIFGKVKNYTVPEFKPFREQTVVEQSEIDEKPIFFSTRDIDLTFNKRSKNTSKFSLGSQENLTKRQSKFSSKSLFFNQNLKQKNKSRVTKKNRIF
jgi:hypothetical protein